MRTWFYIARVSCWPLLACLNGIIFHDRALNRLVFDHEPSKNNANKGSVDGASTNLHCCNKGQQGMIKHRFDNLNTI